MALKSKPTKIIRHDDLFLFLETFNWKKAVKRECSVAAANYTNLPSNWHWWMWSIILKPCYNYKKKVIKTIIKLWKIVKIDNILVAMSIMVRQGCNDGGTALTCLDKQKIWW